jgi:hypothetical protein
MPYKDPEKRRECVRKSRRKCREANPEKTREKDRERHRKWCEANRDKAREINRKYHKASPEKARERDLKRHYGITLDDFAYLAASQDNVCAVCHRPCPSGKRLAVDHCHQTKLVRGLLCGDCNLSAGKLGEDPDRIERLAAYIRAHNTKAADLIGFQINPLPTDQVDTMELQKADSK